MSGKRKSHNQDKALQTIVLITAILNLAEALLELLEKLIE